MKTLSIKRVLMVIVAVIAVEAVAASALFAAGAARADVDEEEILNLIRNAPAAADVPLDDYVLLLDDLMITLHDDGRVERRRHRLIKVMNEWAQDNICDPRIAWDTRTQDLVVHRLRTFMNDGAVVERITGMDKDHNLSQVSPDALELCADYLHHQETVATFLGIEFGCVVEFDYSIVDKTPRGRGLSEIEFLQGEALALQRRLVVLLPAGAGAEWGSFNGAPECVQQTQDNGSRLMCWTLSNVSGERLNTDCAGKGDFVPCAVINAWLDKDAGPLGWYNAFGKELESAAEQSGDLDRKAAEIVDGAEGNDRFHKLHEFARKAIRQVRYPSLLFGEPARPAARVFDSAYASQKDHVVLLWALCRAAGIKSWPMLVSDFNVNGGMGTASAMTDVRLIVVLDDGRYLVDPAAPLTDDLAMNTPSDRIFTPPKTSKAFNILPVRVTVTGHLTLADDLSLTGDIKVRQSGPCSPYLSLAGPASDRESYLADVASRIAPGGKVAGHRILDLARHQTTYSLTVKADSIDPTPNGNILLQLIDPINLVRSALPAIADRPPSTRTSPVSVDHPINVYAKLKIDVAAGCRVASLPREQQVVNGLGTTVFKWSLDGRTIDCEITVDLGKGLIGPQDYPDLRRLLLPAADANSFLIVLRKEG